MSYQHAVNLEFASFLKYIKHVANSVYVGVMCHSLDMNRDLHTEANSGSQNGSCMRKQKRKKKERKENDKGTNNA